MPILRVLDLSHTRIKVVPKSIGGLLQLQFLNLYCCIEIRTCPEELGDLVKLKYLNLNRTWVETIPSGVISRFPRMQVLELGVIKLDDSLAAELESLEHLRELGISITDIQPLLSQRLFSCIMNLHIKECTGLTELALLSSSLLKKTRRMTALGIRRCSELEKLIINSSLEADKDDMGPLFTLEVLSLVDLPKLSNIIWTETATHLHFKHLWHLNIINCNALKDISKEPPSPDSKLIQHENITGTLHLGASTMEAQTVQSVEIAEAIVRDSKGELSATTVNAPMVPPGVLSELAPYVILAEKLGRLVVQLVGGGSGVKTVKVTYASSRAPDDLDTRLLRAIITKGLIEPISSAFVNLVNADFTAKQRGIRITEERVLLDGSPENPIEYVQVQISNVESGFPSAISETGDIKVKGKVKDAVPHLTKVGSFDVDANVNVSFTSVGRIAPRKQAVMAIGVDEKPSKETLKKIGEIPAIEVFVFLKL
ncbi:hypothetical protein ACHQM5_029204 [Ranunculus cassubicifolius]